MNPNNVDFTFKKFQKTQLFLKVTAGTQIPKDWTWDCPCGKTNALTDSAEQWCPGCGTRLRIQEHRDEGREKPGEKTFTVVRVGHFTVREQV
jgi:hypothetical protein